MPTKHKHRGQQVDKPGALVDGIVIAYCGFAAFAGIGLLVVFLDVVAHVLIKNADVGNFIGLFVRFGGVSVLVIFKVSGRKIKRKARNLSGVYFFHYFGIFRGFALLDSAEQRHCHGEDKIGMTKTKIVFLTFLFICSSKKIYLL